MTEYALIMVDECGDEVVVDTYKIGDDLDEFYIELWKATKIEDAREQYPEARRFYFEDRSALRRTAMMMARAFF